MGRAEVLLPLGIVAFGGVIMWEALTDLNYYNYARGAPGAGFLPFWLSLGVVAIGLVLTVRAVRANHFSVGEGEWPDASGWRRIGCVVLMFAIALLVLESLGFLVTAVLYVAVVGFVLGMRSWRVLIPVSILAGTVLYGLVSVWLRVPLPEGILSF